MTGLIFDIQRFSVHDGPGIRTTVFMKGCPLRCRWCHNPEGLSREIGLQFFEEKCIGCGSCGKRESLADAEKCPAEALIVCGKEISEEELENEIMKDCIFYGTDGGVTFSGGECLLQADFVSSVLKRMKSKGIATAVDTSGFVPWQSFEKTLDFCDLYLYDIKAADSDIHREYTGVGNELIISNLKKLSSLKKRLWIRVPVIPGVNDGENEMKRIADIVSGLSSVEQLTLMPYHSLGSERYKTLGLKYTFDKTLSVPEIEMDKLKKIFTDRNIAVK